jgi:high-affinity Fe2+/Pb2+ permease
MKHKDRLICSFLVFGIAAPFMGIGAGVMSVICWLVLGGYWWHGKTAKNAKSGSNDFDSSPHNDEEREDMMNEALLQSLENGETIENAQLAAKAIGALYDKKKLR